jgi:CHAT domain-containing protein
VARDRNDIPTAHDYYSRALAIRERLAPNSLNHAVSLNNLGGLALRQRRFSEALPLFRQAVDIFEGQRWQIQSTDTRALLLAQHTDFYMDLLRTYTALNDLPAAFATAERARARSLLEILTESRAEIRQGVDASLLERERLLQQQLNAKANRYTQVVSARHTDAQAAAAKREVDASLVQYQDLQTQIRNQNPRYAALTQPQPLGLAGIQRELDEGSLLLEYVLGEEIGYLWAVTSSTIKSFELPRRSEIEPLARRVYELLTARQPVAGETLRQRQARIAKAEADYPAAVAALSQIVLGPVSALLSNQRLLVVADGALQYVPFAALPAPANAGTTEAAPLVLHHQIVSLPSASAVAVLRREAQKRKPAEKLIAVLADPVFDGDDPRLKGRRLDSAAAQRPRLSSEVERAVRSAGLLNDRGSLSRLPFTRDEAEAIVASAPAGQSAKVIDFQANRATVTSADLSRYRIVHLATHGVLDTERPELSGIVLSLVDEQGRAQDGFLRLHEIYNLDWSAELVVLSACQTGLGKEIKGEGLVGLTRGFMYAGAERVLASLWNVNDSVTAEFMKRFYQGLISRNLAPAEALREAQVEMWKRRSSRSPYYWAAFVLQGEWK